MDGSSVSGFWIWKLVQVWELRKWPWVFTEAIVLSLLLLHSCPFLVDVKQHHCCPSVFLYFVLLPISISHPPHTLAQAPIGCLSDFAVLVVIPAFWLLVNTSSTTWLLLFGGFHHSDWILREQTQIHDCFYCQSWPASVSLSELLSDTGALLTNIFLMALVKGVFSRPSPGV